MPVNKMNKNKMNKNKTNTAAVRLCHSTKRPRHLLEIVRSRFFLRIQRLLISALLLVWREIIRALVYAVSVPVYIVEARPHTVQETRKD